MSISMNPADMVNEDGTPFNPPKNPLEEKWSKLYPPISKPEFSQVCDGYSCMSCGRCPKGGLWESPEEDIDIYMKYLDEYIEYMTSHNPSLSPLRTSLHL